MGLDGSGELVQVQAASLLVSDSQPHFLPGNGEDDEADAPTALARGGRGPDDDITVMS